jgi:hypothetical protein
MDDGYFFFRWRLDVVWKLFCSLMEDLVVTFTLRETSVPSQHTVSLPRISSIPSKPTSCITIIISISMATLSQLSHLRALLRSLKYMFALASLVAIAGIIFLATAHSRVTTDVLIGMVLCIGLLLTGAFFGWFALWRDPRLRFLYPDRVRVRPRRTRAGPATPGIMHADIGKSCPLLSLRLN